MSIADHVRGTVIPTDTLGAEVMVRWVDGWSLPRGIDDRRGWIVKDESPRRMCVVVDGMGKWGWWMPAEAVVRRHATAAMVRATVRAALDHAGARVPFTMKETGPGAWAVEARRTGQWVVNSGVDGSTLMGLQQTAVAFAREVALAMEALGQCPSCASFPMLCEFHGEQNTRGLAAADEARGERAARRRRYLKPRPTGQTSAPHSRALTP